MQNLTQEDYPTEEGLIWQRAAARSRAVISIVAIEQMGFNGTDVARTLNLTPSAVSKLILRARNDPDLNKHCQRCARLALTVLA